MNKLNDFKKKKDWIVCIDSDGCAMDTMDIKHIQCFGPCMIQPWELEEWQVPILKRWNEINLYTLTRGINRFKGLALMLSEVNETYCPIAGIDEFVKWVETAKELSNASVKEALKTSGLEIFKKALRWSEDVNQSIAELDEDYLVAFAGVLESIEKIHEVADIAIVSSANEKAVEEEWARCGLLPHVDILLAQNVGSKAYCIQELIAKGYNKENVLMIGDALGDLEAAKTNGVNFFPILVRKEEESWKNFRENVLDIFINGNYKEAYQQIADADFRNNLQ